MTENDFLDGLKADSPKDYAKSRLRKLDWQNEALWQLDHRPFVGFLQKKADEVARRGVVVCFNFKLADFSMVADYEVVTLVTHFDSQQNTVELADGMFTPHTIAAQLPADFTGIFDLTVCYSTHLQEAIKHVCPHCTVIANKSPTSFEFRLSFYKMTIEMLGRLNKNYVEAIGDLRLQLINDKNKSNNGWFKRYFTEIHQYFTSRGR